jgi:hypothetical protein
MLIIDETGGFEATVSLIEREGPGMHIAAGQNASTANIQLLRLALRTRGVD